MTYELTDAEKQVIDGNVEAFWADLKVMVHNRAVILYVDSHRRDFDYPVILKYCDNPEEVMQAVLDYPGYANRSTASARYIRGVFEAHGNFSGRLDIQVEAAKYIAKHPLCWIEERELAK